MTFQGEVYRDTIKASSSEASSADKIVCTQCGTRLKLIQQPNSPDKAPHFEHMTNNKCTGAESAQETAQYILEDRLNHRLADVANTQTGAKIGADLIEVDVIVRFDSPTKVIGKGVISKIVQEAGDNDEFIETAHSEGYSALPILEEKMDLDSWTVSLSPVVTSTPEGGYDLVKRLSDSNAPRSCSNCASDADLYLFKAESISKFYCSECISTENLNVRSPRLNQ